MADITIKELTFSYNGSKILEDLNLDRPYVIHLRSLIGGIACD